MGIDLEALGTKQQNNEWFVTFLDQALLEDFLSLGVLTVAGKTVFNSSLNTGPTGFKSTGLHIICPMPH